MFKLRPNQESILSYQGGKMGISAVPGSGKTWTLSLLAAQIVASGELQPDQEVLVVTLVNSAVDNFYQRVGKFVGAANIFTHMGYRVCTLHSLAHDIVRKRPELVGLSEDFQIIDDNEAENIRSDVAQAWLRQHGATLEQFINPDLGEQKQANILRRDIPRLVQTIANQAIRYAKNERLSADKVKEIMDRSPVFSPLAQMAAQLYQDYQRALAYRGAVDFDDLIRLALDALQWDADLLTRLQHSWPYILEDEAQDSSLLQEQILRLLAGPDGNWVRVGDPNQAIFETFTTADPKFLRNFLHEPGVYPQELPHSGRSAPRIIDLANSLVSWTQSEHPLPDARDALQSPPLIELTPPGDPQPNPPDQPRNIYIWPLDQASSPEGEIKNVVNSLAHWLPEHPDQTVAVLSFQNEHAGNLVNALRDKKLPFNDSLLKSSNSTRTSAGVLRTVMEYLAAPDSSAKLAEVFKVYINSIEMEEVDRKATWQAGDLLRKCRRVEDYLWPQLAQDWLADQEAAGEDAQVLQQLGDFRQVIQRWQGAILLPVDQMLLSLGQELFKDPARLALTHKLAVLLHRAGEAHREWRLRELIQELNAIVKNERRFLGFSEDDTGFDPDRYPGRVAVSTIHKAKGLEWDRVYLMSANNYDFPSGEADAFYYSEKWFLQDRLNLEAETLAQLSNALNPDEYAWSSLGEATRQARLDLIRERLRLLYVGITRARRELILTWNTGKDGKRRPALPYTALYTYWERELSE